LGQLGGLLLPLVYALLLGTTGSSSSVTNA
jgi:hypothetical protein